MKKRLFLFDNNNCMQFLLNRNKNIMPFEQLGWADNYTYLKQQNDVSYYLLFSLFYLLYITMFKFIGKCVSILNIPI